MQSHFNFGHTIVPKEQESDSDNMLDLFKIGEQRIVIPKKEEERSDDEEDSDRTVRNKKIKKEKKQKKEHKHKHKQKKQKQKKSKQKKEKKGRQCSSQSIHHQSKQKIVPFNPARKAELIQKYAKALDTKTIDQKLAQSFNLNLKLGQGMLNIDIIRFPQMRLFQYGPMDKEIPRYHRLPDFYNIIGFKKSKHKKAAKIIRELNKIINQYNPRPNSDQISKDRYFHFEGYEHTGLQRLAIDKHEIASETLMRYNLQEGTSGSEEEAVLKATREFNKRLHLNPKNIDLWLQFVGIQERFSLSVGTLKNRNAVIDRKLSILEKALQLNPSNQRLGLLRLNCLFEKQADHKAMASQCLQLIQENPWSVGLWKFYFKMSIQRFGSYSHALLRRTFQQMSELLRRAIEKTKSAVQIWKIRKAALEVTRSMVQVYKMEGFGQLATGIIVALLDYNIFMPQAATTLTRPQEKLQLFQKYWEDCSVYKLGQSSKGSTWSKLVNFIGKQDGFIGNYESTKSAKDKVPCLKQMKESEGLWRISNANWDQKKIQDNPESFVLYEDIEFAMMLYRDSDSTTALIDALADHLQLPLVFSATSAYSQFGLKVLQKALKQAIQSKHRLDWFSFHRQPHHWAQYWNPVFTHNFLSDQRLIKMEYMRRLLVSVKKKMQTKITQINQYLSFIACVVYLSPFAQKVLKISEQQGLSQMAQILQEEPLNLATWSMYIEATFIKMKNTQECLNCYLQLFETAQKMSQTKENLSQIQIQILFWMFQFNKRHNLGKGRVLLKILKLIVMNDADQTFSLERQVNVFDCLQLEQYFRVQTQKMANNLLSKENKESIISRCRASIFINYFLEEYPSSSLEQLNEKTTLLLIGQLDTNENSKNNSLIMKILISFRLLNHQHITKYQLLTSFPFSTLIQYWVSFAKKSFFLLVTEFEQMSQRPLALWMTICAFLWRNRMGEGYMFDYFSTVAKKVCFQQRFCDQKPEFITLLCELLAYDTENHNKFIMFSLQHLPFSKKLYLLNLLLTEDAAQRSKLATIIEEKGIRILNPQILE